MRDIERRIDRLAALRERVERLPGYRTTAGAVGAGIWKPPAVTRNDR